MSSEDAIRKKICSFWCCIAKAHLDIMPYCEKSSFMGCHNRKKRVTYDGTMQKQESLRCHNRKTRVTYHAINQKNSSVRCHNAKNGVS